MPRIIVTIALGLPSMPRIIVTIAFLQSMALAACPPFCWWSYTRANLLYASLLCPFGSDRRLWVVLGPPQWVTAFFTRAFLKGSTRTWPGLQYLFFKREVTEWLVCFE